MARVFGELTAKNKRMHRIAQLTHEDDSVQRLLVREKISDRSSAEPPTLRERLVGAVKRTMADRPNVAAYDANLISSKTTSGLHAPVLDIDFEARLVPSRTKGHFHLYLNKTMPWWRYHVLLWALKVAGIIEPGYYWASIQRRATYCRWQLSTHHNFTAPENVAAMDVLEMMDSLDG